MNKLIHLILILAVFSDSGQAAKSRSLSAPGGSGPISLGKEGFLRNAEKKEEPRRKLMGMIDAFRAEICAKLKDKHGKSFKSFAKCKEFMKKACNPGKDNMMDRDKTEITSRKGYCREYFAEQEAEEKLKKEVGEEEAKKLVEGESPAPAPSPNLAPAPTPDAAPAPEPETTTTAVAPAPAPEPVTPAPAPPAPAPAAVEDDMKYYFKDDGKSKERMHMDEKLKLPTQGYWGKLIEHEDMETMTTDWGREFGRQQYGTHDGFKTYEEICKKYPHNPWCLKHHPAHHKSSGYTTPVHILATAMPILFVIAVA